ncbi:MAG: hypothetical protein CSYNP_03990 [Syntrophus sp. SKADARSKE-3]|nr:hypothetical protein [Syntrophus sp. SKADARSKE-3]
MLNDVMNDFYSRLITLDIIMYIVYRYTTISSLGNDNQVKAVLPLRTGLMSKYSITSRRNIMKPKYLTFSIVIIVMLLSVVAVAVSAEEQPLTNQDIVKLTQLNMGDEVVIAKIKAAQSTKFDTSTDDLIKLKESGVSGPVIAAMLNRSGGSLTGTATDKSVAIPYVTLVAKEGTFVPKEMNGNIKSIRAPFVGNRRYIEFNGNSAKIRIKDRMPSLLIKFDRDPHNTHWLVKMKPWDSHPIRVVDLPSVGRWGGYVSNEPDPSCNIEYTSAEENPGIWRVTPKIKLEPGEYGVFLWDGSGPVRLYDFGLE